MLFSIETLKAYAASKGITAVDEAAYTTLAHELEYRVKELCQEASKFMHASHRLKLSINDVNHALTARNIDPLFGYDFENLNFRQISNFHALTDEEYDIEDLLNKPLPKITAPSVHAHWLCIEGIQPQIPQNICEKKPAAYIEEAEIKNTKHFLTKEHHAYFDKIMEFSNCSPEAAFKCLENDCGIQQLIPYFINAFKPLLFKKDAHIIIGMVFALLKNQYIYIDSYLHSIMPMLLTGILGKKFSTEAREISIQAIKFTYERFSKIYGSLAPRTINTLKRGWLTHPLEEVQLYALKALSALGNDVIKDVVLPCAQSYCESENCKPRVRGFIKIILKDYQEVNNSD